LDGVFDETFNLSMVGNNKHQKSDKDGFVEYINTISLLYNNDLPVINVFNNKIENNKGTYESIFKQSSKASRLNNILLSK